MVQLLTAVFVLVLGTDMFALKALAADTIIPKTWQAKHHRDHPLVGRVFSGTGTETGEKSLIKAMRLSPLVLVGEAHNNPDHHLIQAAVLEAQTIAGWKPDIVLEMVPASMEEELFFAKKSSDTDFSDLAKRLKWEERGWPSFEMYRPIFDAAKRMNLALVAGNISKEQARDIARNGLDVVPAQEQEMFAIDRPLPAAREAELLQRLQVAHCGVMPENTLRPMMAVQRLRDGVMAFMMSRREPPGAVLIAGFEHVRNDRGVPVYLERLAPNLTFLTIGLVEVEVNEESFADYNLKNADKEPVFDFVIFTPKADITDHCAAMREHIKKKKSE